jgi:hypothetical protein
MFPKQVLWERWSLGFESEQGSAHVLRLLAWRFATLFLGRWMVESIWSLVWRRLLGDFG